MSNLVGALKFKFSSYKVVEQDYIDFDCWCDRHTTSTDPEVELGLSNKSRVEDILSKYKLKVDFIH